MYVGHWSSLEGDMAADSPANFQATVSLSHQAGHASTSVPKRHLPDASHTPGWVILCGCHLLQTISRCSVIAPGGGSGDPDHCRNETLLPCRKLRGGTAAMDSMAKEQGLECRACSCSGRWAAYLSGTSFSCQGREQYQGA